MIRGIPARLRATIGLASAQLRHHYARSVLAIVGVGVAVLLVVSLAGLGYGMMTTGQKAIAWLDYDLWATGGPIALAPGAGGIENPIRDAHAVSREMETHPGVQHAQPLGFQTVYVSPDGQNFDTIIGVGIGGEGERILVRQGPGFNESDVHYENGTYDGPMTHTIVVDERTADRYNLSVGDTLHLGATPGSARDHEFTVVGTTRTFSTFLGKPTVAMHLSELQEVSGTTGTDPASLIALTLRPSADRATVQRELERRYPGFDIRTNTEQVQAIVGDHPTVIAAAITLIVLAVVVGVILVLNVLATLVYQQREQLAALKAAGVSERTLIGLVITQGVVLGLLGGVLGLVVVPFAETFLNHLVKRLTGFGELLVTPWWLIAGGLGLALIMGVLGATVAGWRVARVSPLAHLQ